VCYAEAGRRHAGETHAECDIRLQHAEVNSRHASRSRPAFIGQEALSDQVRQRFPLPLIGRLIAVPRRCSAEVLSFGFFPRPVK